MDQEAVKAVDRALVELTQWLGRAAQYSIEHPAVREFGRTVHGRLVIALNLCGPLDIGVLKEALTVREEELPSALLRNRTAPYLHERGAVLLRFSPGVTFEELATFVGILAMNPHDIYDAGGLRVLMSRRGVSQITVEEITHEITTEEIAEERRQRKLRDLFKDTLAALLAGHRIEELDYRDLLELLHKPDVAARIIESETADGTAEALAGLALIALQEEIKTGQPMGAQVIKVLHELGTEARARVFAGFVRLVGAFREALGQIFDDMDEPALAGFLFSALRAPERDIDSFFYILSQVIPDETRRRAVLRRLGARLYDLPFEEGRALGLVMSLTRQVDPQDAFAADRDLIGRAARDIARMRFPLRARNETVRIPEERFAPDVLDRLDHRLSATLLSFGSRLVDFQQHVEKLPRLAESLAGTRRGGALAGLFQGVVQIRDPRWKLLMDDTIAKLAATSAAAAVAQEIEKFAGAYKQHGEALAPMLQVIAQHHAGALIELLEKSPNRDTRVLLLDVLPAAGASLLPYLRDRMRHRDWFVVRNMVILMRRLAVPCVELFPVVQHPHPAVRLEVLRALRAVAASDEQAVGMLIDYLSDEDGEIRSGALLALNDARLSDRDVARLETAAVDESRSEEVRKAAIRALGRSASNAAARALMRMLEPKGLIELPSTGAMRERVAVALRDSKAPEAASLFEAALRSSSWRVRRACERAREGVDG